MSGGLPVAIAMAGGYARDIADSVEIHAATLVAAPTHVASSTANSTSSTRSNATPDVPNAQPRP